jgi:hypothetical protein
VNIGWGKLNNLYIKKIAGIGLEANFIEWNEMRRLQVEYCTDYGIKFSGSVQNHLEAWVGDSRIDLGLESGSNGNIIYGIFENHAAVTDYHLLIKASVGNQITGWWESVYAPNYAQVKIFNSAHNNTIQKALFYSVNTGRDWIIIGDEADAAPTGLTHISDCYFSPGVSGGKYHVNIVKGNSARIDRNWCSNLSGEIAVYENDANTTVANTFIPRKEDSWLVAPATNYAISFKDHERVIDVYANAGELTPTLPDPAKHKGLRVMVRKSDNSANKVILSAAPYYIYGAGSTVFRLLSRNDYVEVISNGTVWEVIGCRVMKTASVTPASVAANSTSTQTFTFSGIYADNVTLVQQPAQTSGIIAVASRVTTTDTLEITFANVTSGALTPAAGSYTIAVFR